jgi:hypothetical protein
MKIKVYVIGNDHSKNWDGTNEEFVPVEMSLIESNAIDSMNELNDNKFPANYYIKEMYLELSENA